MEHLQLALFCRRDHLGSFQLGYSARRQLWEFPRKKEDAPIIDYTTTKFSKQQGIGE